VDGKTMCVAAIMLMLAFVGMMITHVKTSEGWDYWRWTVGIYALLALWLSWYMKRQTKAIAPFTIVHELIHWAGVIGAVFLVATYVHMGIISRYAAGLFDLTLLSLGIFLAGIYIERTFIFIGIVLGLLGIFTAFINQYIYIVMIPLIFIAALVIGITIWHSHRRFENTH
jgi:hypothetical protein